MKSPIIIDEAFVLNCLLNKPTSLLNHQFDSIFPAMVLLACVFEPTLSPK